MRDSRWFLKLSALAPDLVLLAAVFLSYANVYQNEFFFDDEFLILKNQFLRSWSHLGEILSHSSTGGAGQNDNFYRPVQTLFYLLVYQLAGLSKVGFHFLNVALHALNALVMWRLGQRLGFNAKASWFAALIWAVHPLHTEAVTYMSATADPAHALFCLLGLIWATPPAGGPVRPARVAGGTGFFVLALLSKEPAIVFPALAMICRFVTLPTARKWSARAYVWTIPYWALAFGYLGARRTVLDFDHTFQFYRQSNIYSENWLYRVYTFLATLPSYLELMLWPRTLVMERNFPVYTGLYGSVLCGGLIVLAAGLALAMGRGRRAVGLSFAGLWFFAAYGPQSGILIPVNALFLEHWMYLPMVGLGLGLAETAVRLASRRVARAGAGGLVVVAFGLGARTWAQNRIWANPKIFYHHILDHNPKDARAMNNLAMAYSDEHDAIRAEDFYRRAIAISDVYPQSHYNLALLLLGQNQAEAAITELKRALELDPHFGYATAKLAEIYGQLGELDKQREYLIRLGH